MPFTVKELLDRAGIVLTGKVKWGEPINCEKEGIYIIAIANFYDKLSVIKDAPIDLSKIEELIRYKPHITLNDNSTDAGSISKRLKEYWIPDETILYIGKTERTLTDRIGEYYRHKLGDNRPHRGGDWIKTLSIIDNLYVYYSAINDPAKKEKVLLHLFGKGITQGAENSKIYEVPIPFANKAFTKRKNHRLKY